MQEVFLLLLVEVNTRLVLDVSLELGKLDLAALHLQQFEATLAHVVNSEQPDLILHREGQIGAGKVDEHRVVVDIHERHGALVGDIIVEMDELLG